jgi:4-amino-4-deoxy-L-arabinose transferase-like glycosyltransferase
VATLGAGAPLCRRLIRHDATAFINLPLIVLTGAGVLATALTGLALIGLFRVPVVVTVLLAAAALGCRECLSGLWTEVASLPRPPVIAWLPLAAFAALVPVLAAPPVMYDALNYHLAFPDHWLAAGGFLEFPRHGFSYYPSSYGMLYGCALATVGPWGATAIHFWFGAAASLTAASLGARLAGPMAAAWVGACFALTPAVLEVAAYATADLVVAAWAGAALAALLLAPDGPPEPGRAALAGFLVGCALAAKYLAFAVVLLPFLAVLGFSVPRRSWRGSLSVVAAAGAAAALPVVPWLVRNLIWTGNPLYPYLQGVLGGPPTGMGVGSHVAQIGGAEPGSLLWASQAIVALGLRTIEPLGQGGILGPLWLLLLPVAALLPGAGDVRALRRSLWIFTIGGLLAWGALVQMARFLLPVLVVAAPLAGAAAAALVTSPRPAVRWSFRLLLGFCLFWASTMVATTQNLDRLAVAAGRLDDVAYMKRWISYHPVIEHLNRELEPGSKVLFVAEPRSFYVAAPLVVEDPFRTPLLVELAAEHPSAAAIARRLADLGVTHLMVNSHEMALSARLRGVDDFWSGASPAERRAIDELLTHWTVRTAGDPTLWVGRITSRNERAP